MGRDERLTHLLAQLESADGEQRLDAIQALRLFNDRRSSRPLITLALADSEIDVRREAAWSLGLLIGAGSIRFIEAAQPLLIALGNEHPLIRGNAALALGRLQQTDETIRVITRQMAALLRDPSAYVRRQAAFWMLKFGDSRAREGLAALLADPDDSLRAMAEQALAGLE